MKKYFKFLLGATFLISSFAYAENNGQEYHQRSEKVISKGSDKFFTGDVKVQEMTKSNEINNYGTAYVTFAPGARSAWHTHPAGQTLVVISGTCWTQVWNGEKTIAKTGDVIWCPVGVKHWHGASPNEEMTHFTITGMKDGKNVEWLEKVSDEQYLGK